MQRKARDALELWTDAPCHRVWTISLPAIGCVVEGLPSGIVVDQDALAAFMARRAPGQGSWTTPRREEDRPHIVSGLNVHGATCGAPLAAIIENTNTRSGDYDNLLKVPRPGHADLTAWEKWHGNQDVPGGGHFSGRLTAPLCVAGGIALQALAARGVRIGAHLLSVANVEDERFDGAMEVIEKVCKSRKQIATSPSPMSGATGVYVPYPIEVVVGGATVFVTNVERFEKL